MTEQLTNRVSRLEIVQKNQESEIHDIHTKVEHIDKKMSDLKTISKNNTIANTQTNEKLTDIHYILHEFKGGWRVVKIVGGLFVSIIGLSLTILTIMQIIKNGG